MRVMQVKYNSRVKNNQVNSRNIFSLQHVLKQARVQPPKEWRQSPPPFFYKKPFFSPKKHQ